MYQPGGAMFFSVVRVPRTTLGGAAPTIGTSTRRCSTLKEWVVRPGRMRLTCVTFAACFVLIVIVAPYETSTGASSIAGRGP